MTSIGEASLGLRGVVIFHRSAFGSDIALRPPDPGKPFPEWWTR